MYRLISLFFTLLLLSNCAKLLDDDDSALFGNSPPSTTQGLGIVGNKLAKEYLSAADNSAAIQDAGVLSLIGFSSYGAFGVIEGFGAQSLAKIGLSGFAVSQSVNYFNTPGATRSLLNASSRAACLSQVAFRDNDFPLGTPQYRAISAGFLQNAIILRTELARDIPDYAQIIQNAQTAAAAFTPSDESAIKSAVAQKDTNTVEDERLRRIEDGVGQCLSSNL